MATETMRIPRHIADLVSALERWIQAASLTGSSYEQAESYSLSESEIQAQLHVLGWDAVLNAETGRWAPIPAGYTIVANPPDQYYYPQRCYQIPEGPAQWHTLWEDAREVRFTSWHEAYSFVFAHLAQEQAQLPQKRFCVRPLQTCGGDDYLAISAEQAVQMHRNYWCAARGLTPGEAVCQPLHVFEHCGDKGFYCWACQHAPCKYTLAEQWSLEEPPMPLSTLLQKTRIEES
jgi:hypothetical protein